MSRLSRQTRLANASQLLQALENEQEDLRVLVYRKANGNSDVAEEAISRTNHTAAQRAANIADGNAELVLDPRAWLYRITINNVTATFGDRSRERSHAGALGEMDVPDRRTDATTLVETNEAARDIVASLSQEELKLLELRLTQQLSWNEIGDILGRSPVNVRQMYSRLIRRLRDQFGDAE